MSSAWHHPALREGIWIADYSKRRYIEYSRTNTVSLGAGLLQAHIQASRNGTVGAQVGRLHAACQVKWQSPAGVLMIRSCTIMGLEPRSEINQDGGKFKTGSVCLVRDESFDVRSGTVISQRASLEVMRHDCMVAIADRAFGQEIFS